MLAVIGLAVVADAFRSLWDIFLVFLVFEIYYWCDRGAGFELDFLDGRAWGRLRLFTVFIVVVLGFESALLRRWFGFAGGFCGGLRAGGGEVGDRVVGGYLWGWSLGCTAEFELYLWSACRC